MMRFNVTTEGRDELGLRELCERFANNLWVPEHLAPEQAEAFAVDCFRRTVLAELELLEIKQNE